MCYHIFSYPEDKRDNYNPDKTLTGVYKICGTTQRSYGIRWTISEEEGFLYDPPYSETLLEGLQDKYVL